MRYAMCHEVCHVSREVWHVSRIACVIDTRCHSHHAMAYHPRHTRNALVSDTGCLRQEQMMNHLLSSHNAIIYCINHLLSATARCLWSWSHSGICAWSYSGVSRLPHSVRATLHGTPHGTPHNRCAGNTMCASTSSDTRHTPLPYSWHTALPYTRHTALP